MILARNQGTGDPLYQLDRRSAELSVNGVIVFRRWMTIMRISMIMLITGIAMPDDRQPQGMGVYFASLPILDLPTRYGVLVRVLGATMALPLVRIAAASTPVHTMGAGAWHRLTRGLPE